MFIIILVDMATHFDLADILFPEVTETIDDLNHRYPERTTTVVTRIAPSPVSYTHLDVYKRQVTRSGS